MTRNCAWNVTLFKFAKMLLDFEICFTFETNIYFWNTRLLLKLMKSCGIVFKKLVKMKTFSLPSNLPTTAGGGGRIYEIFNIYTIFLQICFFAKICLKFFLNWFQFKIWNYSINSKENLVIIFRIKKNPEFKFSVTN